MKRHLLHTLTIISLPFIWNGDVYASNMISTQSIGVPFIMQGHDILWG